METTIGSETMDTTTTNTQPKTKHWKTRIFSFAALAALIGSCGYVGNEGYRLATDGFIAPFVLGPNNDLVVQSELKIAEVRLEKGRALSERKAIEVTLANSEQAMAKLDALKELGTNALAFTKTTTNQQVSIGGNDLATLADEKRQLRDMQERQALLTAQAKKDYEAGTITLVQYQQQQQALDTIQVALYNNDHVKMQTDVLLGQATLGLQSLTGHQNGNNSMPMPAILTAADLMGRIELQKLQLDGIMSTELAEKERISKELVDIEVLEKHLMSRPIFAAVERNLTIAFVPYSTPFIGSRHPTKGDSIYDCVAGVVACKKVGLIVNVIDGENVLASPLDGTPTRGYYVSLDISTANSDSLSSKMLRARPNDGGLQK